MSAGRSLLEWVAGEPRKAADELADLRAENERLTARVAELEADAKHFAAKSHVFLGECIGVVTQAESERDTARAEVESLKAGNEKLFHQNTDLMNEVDDLKAALADSVPMEMFDSLKAQLGEAQKERDAWKHDADKEWGASATERHALTEQLRVAREALWKSQVALRTYTVSDGREGAAKLRAEALDAIDALSVSTPKAEPEPEHTSHEFGRDCARCIADTKAETRTAGLERCPLCDGEGSVAISEQPKAEHVAIEMGLLACTECEAPPHEGSCPEGPTKAEPNLKCDDCGKDAGIIVCTGCWEKHRGRADLMRVAEAGYRAGHADGLQHLRPNVGCCEDIVKAVAP